MLQAQIGHTVEAYIDDLIVKSKKESNHLQDLAEVFEILKLHKLHLNPEKCAFGVSAGKFLGYLVTQRVSAHAVSLALVRRVRTEDMPVYFTSKTLLRAETRYLPLEKLAFALVSAAKKLLPYFQSHTITVLTEHPLKSLFRKANLSNRVSKWAVELANFDIRFEPRRMIKGQNLIDFIAELTPEDTDILNTPTPQPITESTKAPMPWQLFQGNIWRLHVDEASNSNGAGAGIVLASPCGTLHESSLSIDFPATNNEAEYEALLTGLRSAVAMKVFDLVVYCDSQLIVNQVLGNYEAQDLRMSKYQAIVAELITHFQNFKIKQINREHNALADALAGLASASKASEFRTINFGSIDHPSFDTIPEVLNVELGPSWMDEIIAFLKHDTLPVDKKEAYRIRNKAAYYWLSESGQLYRKSFSGPYLFVVHPTQVPEILTELHSDYFSKWVKVEPLATITEADVRRFVWRNIVTRFNIPYSIVSDNGSQFIGKDLTSLYAEFGIRFFNFTPVYPQGNGQAEATIKIGCARIKRRLNSKRGKWAEELPRVLWVYRSTPTCSTGQMPFSMAFGMEVVIPLESRFPTLKTENFDPKTNGEDVEQKLILAEEKRDDAQLKLVEYQQQVTRGYNRSVQTKTFKPDDLVWRKVVQASKKQKCKPNWEGPFRVVKIIGECAYVLYDMNGKILTNPWNAQNLKKAYM
ncbi:uncharacterized protein LOC131321289 [Rhododendron vialii]|uniref:uncharacterized protein LOC131321289 n=1 Tax=Rhododendron vialii TaxID=182163 RepID=UPI00265F16E1|nr:uncharacterized protein LOC131321289 [Rhododendron vialii]